MNIVFSRQAARELEKISRPDQRRIVRKPEFFLQQENPLDFAEPLHHHAFGSFRFRVGDYRILFDVHNETLSVLKVGHRREIYR